MLAALKVQKTHNDNVTWADDIPTIVQVRKGCRNEKQGASWIMPNESFSIVMNFPAEAVLT